MAECVIRGCDDTAVAGDTCVTHARPEALRSYIEAHAVELALYERATRFDLAFRGSHVAISRFNNHMRLLADGEWAVSWKREVFLLHHGCNDTNDHDAGYGWAYKAYTGFKTPLDALAALNSTTMKPGDQRG